MKHQLVDSYSESTTDGYSANYVNTKLSELESVGKTVTFNNEWRNAFKPAGDNLNLFIPINNPSKKAPTISNLTAEIYDSGWKSCTYTLAVITETEVCFALTPPSSVSLVNGNVYLCRLSGTITVN